MKNVHRNIVLSICYVLIMATFIVSCDWAQRDANTRKEIVTVEEQIRQIDRQIAQRIAARQEPESNTEHTTVYVDNNRSYAQKMMDDLMSSPRPIHFSDNNIIDAEIHKLKSEREMLMVRLTALYRSLNK